MAYNPASGETRVVATGFWFANGCALAADESYVLVSDTNAATIVKVHLKGPKVSA